jgi:hypothetical protein
VADDPLLIAAPTQLFTARARLNILQFFFALRVDVITGYIWCTESMIVWKALLRSQASLVRSGWRTSQPVHCSWRMSNRPSSKLSSIRERSSVFMDVPLSLTGGTRPCAILSLDVRPVSRLRAPNRHLMGDICGDSTKPQASEADLVHLRIAAIHHSTQL